MTYLCSAYSDPDPAVRRARFEAVCRCAAALMAKGHRILSPIAHSHPIAEAGDLPKGWEFWQAYDRELIAACDEVWVFCHDGWYESKGVRAEIAIADELHKPLRYVFQRPDGEYEWRKSRADGETVGPASRF